MIKRKQKCFFISLEKKEMKRLPCIFAIDESNVSVFMQFINQLKQDGMLSGPTYEYIEDGIEWRANVTITLNSRSKSMIHKTDVIANGPRCVSKSKARQSVLMLLMPLIVDLCSLVPYRLSFKGRPVGFIRKDGKITFC